jgi:hypothetical protein
MTIDIAEGDNYTAVDDLPIGMYIITKPPAPVIQRRVTLNISPHFASNPAPGSLFVESTHTLTITLTPLPTLPDGYEPQVTTNRISLPDDKGGVMVMRNDDGTYTVLIAHIQQDITVTVATVSPVANEHIAGARVWSYGNRLSVAAGATEGQAYIYNAASALVKILPFAAGETVGATLPAGVYVVATEGRQYKVVVK